MCYPQGIVPLCTRALAGLALCAAAVAAEPSVDAARDLPRFPAVEPADAVSTMKVKPGFHMELAAAEPHVCSPVAVCFDENGRMFVAEMIDYSEQRELKPHLGRIRMLEDADADGVYEKSSIFADDLPWPTALIWANGGLYVCATPDIFFYKETGGSGRAPERQLAFTGFGTAAAKLNVQGLPNCFQWGPDNRIHLQCSSTGRGKITCPTRPDLKPLDVGSGDFWFDPRTLEFGAEPGGGQYGMSFDSAGRRYVCNNSDHLRVFVFEDLDLSRNSYASAIPPLQSIAADGPAAEVFRISPDEPWRVIRTRWRVAGTVKGIVEGGGRVSGYFTGATGTTIYRGDAYPAEYRENAFIGDAGGNLVHRKVISPDGCSLSAKRGADEANVEFLASRDTWFRPVNFANAPDGTLYVIDMYREVIEHPASLPEEIKKHLDLTSGRDRGRIWRIAPDGFRPRPAPKLGAAPTKGLLEALSNANGWTRDTATRLLCERQDPQAIPMLEALLSGSSSAFGRLHALRALDGMRALSSDALAAAVSDGDAAVREAALKLIEMRIAATPTRSPGAYRTVLLSDSSDPNKRVEMQRALAAGASRDPAVATVLSELAARNLSDRWITAAVLAALPEYDHPLFEKLMAKADLSSSPLGIEFLTQLARRLGKTQEDLLRSYELLVRDKASLRLIAALEEGASRSGLSIAKTLGAEQLNRLMALARQTIELGSKPDEERIAAVRLLGKLAPAEACETLPKILSPSTPPAVTGAAIGALLAIADPRGIEALFAHWSDLSPSAKTDAIRQLLSRPKSTITLLREIADGRIKPETIDPTQIKLLQESKDAVIADLAKKTLPLASSKSRDELIRDYTPALSLSGDRAKGHATFTQRCVICHRLRGEGNAFGPDLESTVTGGKEKLLTHIIDPNREVAPQFTSYTIELKDGSALAGVLAGESPAQVTLREPLGKQTTLSREQIARMQTTGRSPMPEGLEAGLTAQDLADLLSFLTNAAQ